MNPEQRERDPGQEMGVFHSLPGWTDPTGLGVQGNRLTLDGDEEKPRMEPFPKNPKDPLGYGVRRHQCDSGH